MMTSSAEVWIQLPTKKNNKPKAEEETAQPTAAWFNKGFITRLKLFRRKTQIIDCKDNTNFKRAIFFLKQTERLLMSDVFKKKKNKVGRQQK